MSPLLELTARWAQPGRIEWIGLRPDRRTEIDAVNTVMLTTDGLSGDRGRAGKRAVTLIQQEHLAAIGSYLGQGPVAPDTLRRNLVVSGINLAALKGREVQVGEAILRFTVICAPRWCGPGGFVWVIRCNLLIDKTLQF